MTEKRNPDEWKNHFLLRSGLVHDLNRSDEVGRRTNLVDVWNVDVRSSHRACRPLRALAG